MARIILLLFLLVPTLLRGMEAIVADLSTIPVKEVRLREPADVPGGQAHRVSFFLPTACAADSIKFLNSGTFSKVAGCRMEGKDVAIKRIHLDPREEHWLAPRQAEILKVLEINRHLPKIAGLVLVQFSYAVEYDGQADFYFVMDAAQRDLFNWRSDLGTSRSVFYTLTEVLVKLAARLLVHRDIKSENCLVWDREDPARGAWCDFGFLAVAGTKAPEVQGTVHCLAPELWHTTADDANGPIFAQDVINHPSVDVFALGLAFYEHLTGLPFWFTPGDTLNTREGLCSLRAEVREFVRSASGKGQLRALLLQRWEGARKANDSLGIELPPIPENFLAFLVGSLQPDPQRRLSAVQLLPLLREEAMPTPGRSWLGDFAVRVRTKIMQSFPADPDLSASSDCNCPPGGCSIVLKPWETVLDDYGIKMGIIENWN